MMKIDPVYFEVFGAYFNVELLEPDNREQLKREAGFCASALSQRIVDVETLISDLSQFLEEWDAKTVLRLIAVTNTDWFADEEAESSLRYIITEIIEGLKFYRRSQSPLEAQAERLWSAVRRDSETPCTASRC